MFITKLNIQDHVEGSNFAKSRVLFSFHIAATSTWKLGKTEANKRKQRKNFTRFYFYLPSLSREPNKIRLNKCSKYIKRRKIDPKKVKERKKSN